VKLFDGVRVLDLSRMLAGPYGSMLLADQGAEVIKIEEPDGGDPMRVMGPPFLPDGSEYDVDPFSVPDSDKVTLLADRSAALLAHDLVAHADVVWENFRPGVMARLGCDYPELAALNPGLVMCSISAYGQDGPYRDWPGYDLVLQAMGGAMSFTGFPGQPPVRAGTPIADRRPLLLRALARLYRGDQAAEPAAPLAGFPDPAEPVTSREAAS